MPRLISGSTLRKGGSGEFIDLSRAQPQLPPTETTATGFTLVTDSLLRTSYRSSLGFIEFRDSSMFTPLKVCKFELLTSIFSGRLFPIIFKTSVFEICFTGATKLSSLM